MNPSLPMMQGLGNRMDIGVMLAIPGYPSKSTAIPINVLPMPLRPSPSLSSNAEEVINSAQAILTELVMRTISTRNAHDFQSEYEKVFPSYFEVAWGLSLL